MRLGPVLALRATGAPSRRMPAALARKKRPPERLCPRGAKDKTLFRERLDAARPGHRRHGAGYPIGGTSWMFRRAMGGCGVHAHPPSPGGRAHWVYPKRTACFLAGGCTLRGPQGSRRREIPRCRPIHVDHSAYFLPEPVPLHPDGTCGLTREAARLENLPLCVKGVFLACFFRTSQGFFAPRVGVCQS
jgi:hypothetical protein